MDGILKDDLTVALDEVDRTASRIVTIYQDLAGLADDPALADRFEQEAARRRQALTAFNRERRAAGQTPEVADPERAHLASLWFTLKAAVAGERAREQMERSLAELDERLAEAVRGALALSPPAAIAAALAALDGDRNRRPPP